MPDEIPPAGTVAPAAPAAVPPTPPAVAPPLGDPDWLNGRLAQAKKNAEADLLKSLGFESPEAAKAAGIAAKAAADATKTTEQRATEAVTQAATEKARADSALALIADEAKAQMATLTDPQRALIVATAGDDPSKQLAAIRYVRAAVPGAPVVTTPAAPPPVPPPANTSAAGGAPPAVAPGTPNHRAVYEALEKQNPMLAAQYAERHGAHLFNAQ